MQLDLLIDIGSAMLQNRDYSLSLHELELTKITQLKSLQLLNQLPQNHSPHTDHTTLFAELPPSIAKTAQIKLYCQLIISAVQSQQESTIEKHMDSLFGLIEDSGDLQKASYFLFGVTSLRRLQLYEVELNK